MNQRASILLTLLLVITGLEVAAQSRKPSESPKTDNAASEDSGHAQSVCPIGTSYKEVKNRLEFLKTEPRKFTKEEIQKLYGQNVLPWISAVEKKEVSAWLEKLSPTEQFHAHSQRENLTTLRTWTIVYRGSPDDLRVADVRLTHFCVY